MITVHTEFLFDRLDSRLLGMTTVSGTYVNIVNDVINSTRCSLGF